MNKIYQNSLLKVYRMTASEFQQALPQLRRERSVSIISDLIQTSALAKLKDFDTFEKALDNEIFGFSANYISGFPDNVIRYYQGKPFKRKDRRRLSINAFRTYIRDHPDSPLMCNESLTPPSLLENISLRKLGISEISRDVTLPADGYKPEIANSFIFFAGEGNYSQMHTDWDGRDVILHQVFGEKRVTVVPTHSAFKVQPLFVLSSVNFQNMQPAERDDFVTYTKGYTFDIKPGESVYLPPFIWHHLEYQTDGASINFRFGGIANNKVRSLLSTLHVNAFSQIVIDALMKMSETNPAKAEHIADNIIAIYQSRYLHSRSKYHAMEKTLQKLCSELLSIPEASIYHSWLSNNLLASDVLARAYTLPNGGWKKSRQYRWIWNEFLRDRLRQLFFKLANIL